MQNYHHPNNNTLISKPNEQNTSVHPLSSSTYLRAFEQQVSVDKLFFFAPTHIALPLPLHLSFVLKEKLLSQVRVEIGWLHQGIEKTFETIPWKNGALFAGRINPLVSAPVALAFILAVEQLLDITNKISETEQNYRIAVLECSRIYHHHRVIGQIINQLAFHSINRDSAKLLKVIEKILALLLSHENQSSAFCIGGSNRIFSDLDKETLPVLIDKAAKLNHMLFTRINDETNLKKRLTAIGIISKESALSLGLTGPTLRACGIFDDLRISHPYFNYRIHIPNIITETAGDAWARFSIRVHEISASFTILEKICPEIFKGEPIPDFDSSKIPKGTQTAYTESPEGEMAITIVSDEESCPYRVRLRTASFALTSALPLILNKADIDDVILIILSLGITGLEVDR
ncbi:MAG: hypothetical protein O2897_01910 [bacterium]|nr:hypothetical protein [bacterium]